MTMHQLTEGRFSLGLGRGIAPMFDVYGLPPITTAQIEDFVGLMRRLWRGEMIVGHDGPAGRSRCCRLDPTFDVRHPARASRPSGRTRSRSAAARSTPSCCTRSSPTRRSRARRDGATRRRAGGPRPGDRARLVVLRDDRRPPARGPAPQEDGRAPGDLPAGLRRPDGRARTAGTLRVLARFRADRSSVRCPGAIDAKATTEQLEHIATLHPDEWLAPAATGTARQCVERRRASSTSACDGVILHGASPADLEPVVDAYDAIRPAGRFDDLPATPAPTEAPSGVCRHEPGRGGDSIWPTSRQFRPWGQSSNGPRPICSRTGTTVGLVSERRCQLAPSTTRVCPLTNRAYGEREERGGPPELAHAGRPAAPVGSRPCRGCGRGCR